MACEDWSSGLEEALLDGSFIDAVTCPYYNNIGSDVFALLFFGGMALALFIHTENPAIPIVVGIIGAGFFIAELPASAASVAMVVILFGGTAALYIFIRRIRRP